MGLQEQIAEAIILAFDELGGDPQNAVSAARQHKTVEDWLQQETLKIAAAGGVEMIIPGLHALTIPAGISYLIHKMAAISWGIGAIKGCYIVETADHSDLRNILTLWANGSYYSAHLLEHTAIRVDLLQHTLAEAGYRELESALRRGEHGEMDDVLWRTLQLMKTIGDHLSGDERAVRLLQTIGTPETTDALLEGLSYRPTPVAEEVFQRGMSGRMSARLAGRLATYISARIPARLVVGFIPIAGAVVNAFFNAQTLQSMADTAVKYYDHALTMKQFSQLAETSPPPASKGRKSKNIEVESD